MLPFFKFSIASLTAFLMTAALAACTAPGDATDQAGHHPDKASGIPVQSGGAAISGQSGGAMMEGQTGAGMMGDTTTGHAKQGSMDMNRMCSMYREMQNTPMEQRQAMMDQRMKGMSPEMRQQHMEMMRQQCK
jgi:hypothetical protein